MCHDRWGDGGGYKEGGSGRMIRGLEASPSFSIYSCFRRRRALVRRRRGGGEEFEKEE